MLRCSPRILLSTEVAEKIITWLHNCCRILSRMIAGSCCLVVVDDYQKPLTVFQSLPLVSSTSTSCQKVVATEEEAHTPAVSLLRNREEEEVDWEGERNKWIFLPVYPLID